MSNYANPIDKIIDYLKSERERRVNAYNTGYFCDTKSLSNNIDILAEGINAMNQKKEWIIKDEKKKILLIEEDKKKPFFNKLIEYLKEHGATAYGFRNYDDGELYFYIWSYGDKYDIRYKSEGFVFCCHTYENMELLIEAIELKCRRKF